MRRILPTEKAHHGRLTAKSDWEPKAWSWVQQSWLFLEGRKEKRGGMVVIEFLVLEKQQLF